MFCLFFESSAVVLDSFILTSNFRSEIISRESAVLLVNKFINLSERKAQAFK